MKTKFTVTKRILAIVLCIALLAAYLPSRILYATAAADSRVADAHTLDQWKQYFGHMDGSVNDLALTTEFAGGVWTDKSVFLPGQIPAQLTDAVYNGATFPMEDNEDNFLVALSAIASNKEIVGYSTIPTDTVFILDLSSSMRSNDDNGGSAIDELVEATNNAITDLQALNRNNRVAVVLYAGNTSGDFNSNPGATTVILPLDTYSAGNGGNFLVAASYQGNPNYAVTVASGVSGSSGAISGRMNTARGTFTQDGIYEAMRVLLGADPVVNEGIQAGTKRLPIMVLMTDGEPTQGNRSYNGNAAGTDLGNSEIYLKFNNQDYNHRDTIAWLTQLTAAYAKREVSQHYGNESGALFYTLAFGEESTRLEEAQSVMDPAKTSDTLNGFWEDFLAGRAVNVYTYTQNRQTFYYTTSNDTAEPLTAADKLYVDKSFNADSDQAMMDAFQNIVNEIIIQSKYYPTYVQTDHDHDGYLTFVDKIGEYMEVTDMKGIVIGSRLFSGAALAAMLENGGLGTIANPNTYGENVVASVMERFGITDKTVAQALLSNAYNHGQLAYTNDQEFSHYIGWYSDAEGRYLDFWHEGMPQEQKPAGATHRMKSYGFLGDTSVVPGVSDTDMMYMTVRIATEIATGESIMTWRIPASLVPTITYEVTVDVDNNGNITSLNSLNLESGTADAPIRLLYEVALREDIRDWNLTQKVSDTYRDSTTNKADGYVFYTNKWQTGDPEDTQRNTYSHFEPSVQNERYYYTQDTRVCTDENGTVYTGSKPSGSGYYHALQVYEKLTSGQLRIHTHYEPISAEAMEEVEADGSNWVIPKGTVRRYYDYEISAKENNNTGTMGYSDHPFVVWNAAAGHYYTYSTQGNNGMLTAIPATGIKLTKTLAEGYANAGDFTFRLAGDISNAELVYLDRQGEEASRVKLDASGEFTLKADQTVYIVGLAAGNYTVTELIDANADYKVAEVLVDGIGVGTQADLTLSAQRIADVKFTNNEKGYADLYISKRIAHHIPEVPVPDTVMNQVFTVQVDFGVGLAGREFLLEHTGAGNSTIVVEADGTNELTLKHGETIAIRNIPEGTVITVTELNVDAHFDVNYRSRNHSGHTPDADGSVVITTDADHDTHDAATVVITNTYTPTPVTVDLNVNITKSFTIEEVLAQDMTFDFVLERYNGTDWQTVSTQSVTYPAGTAVGTEQKAISMALANVTFNNEGDHDYRVYEIPGSVQGLAYDPTIYTFTVKVTDNGGALVAEIVDRDNNTVSGSYEVTFVNTFHAAPISIDILKKVNPGMSAAGFTITVTEMHADWTPTGVTYSEITDGGGQIRFAGSYNAPGEHYFTIRESIPAEATLVSGGTYDGMYFLNGWYYDPIIYYGHISITMQSDGDLQAVLQIGTDPMALTGSTTHAELTFENIYEPVKTTLDLDVIPTVKKVLTGRELTASDDFTFYVYADGDYSTVLSTGKVGDRNGDAYTVVFDKALSFSKAGVYQYDVVEKNGGKQIGGVTYDPTIYDMVVTVTDNNGALEVNYYFEDAVDQTVTFTNTYHIVENAELILSGSKSLTGRPMLNGEFTFTLTQVTDETGAAAVTDGLTLQTENNSDSDHDGVSDFAFPAITYTPEDVGKTYYYRVEEAGGGQTVLGVKYDAASYVIKVTVEDNGDGTLKITDTVVGGAQLRFANTYVPNSVRIALPGLKEMTGRELNGKDYNFVITQTESDFTTVKANGFTETVSNNAKGNFAFGVAGKKLSYGSTGSYYYVVTEDTSANQGGVTYDTSVYLVTVKVTDDHTGQLKAKISTQKRFEEEVNGVVTETVIPVSSVVFNNLYEAAPAEYTPAAIKQYDGDTMRTFDFVLSGEGFATQTKQNDSDGNVMFDKLVFTEEGSFVFEIKEQINASYDSVKWDTNVYTLTIVVEDNDAGQLEIVSKTVTSLFGRNDLIFRNVHEDAITEKTVERAEEPGITIDGQKVEKGDELVYNISYTNYTGVTADVIITDTIPNHTAYVEGSAQGATYADGMLTWEIKNIPAYDTVTVSFRVKVTAAGETVKNRAQVLEGHNTYRTNETENPVVADEVKKDVFLATENTVSIDGKKVAVGEVLEYAITYTNADDAAATVVITDTVPAHTSFVAGSAGTGVYTDGVITWTLDIPAGQTREVRFQVTVDAPNVFIDNQATAREGTNSYETNKVDNHTFEEIGGKSVALASKPNIRIDGKLVRVGDILEYAIEYTNVTDAPVDVTITDQIPAYTKLHDAKDGAVDAGVITWTLQAVAPRQTVTVTFQVEVTDPGVTVENQALIFDGRNKVTNTVTNSVPEKTVDKQTASVDDLLTYTISYTNTTGAAAKAVITDKLDEALAYVEGSAQGATYADGVLTWTLDNVPAGETVTVTFQAKVVAAGKISNTAQVYENESAAVFTNETVTQAQGPELSIRKEQAVGEGTATTEKQIVNADDVVTYILTVTNNGAGAAYGITVTDKIPKGLIYVRGSANENGTMADGVVTWTLDALNAGESVQLVFSVVVPDVLEKTLWKNVATLVDSNEPGEDTEITSNEVELEEEPEPLPEEPDTGDSFNPILPVTMMAVSLMGLVVLLIMKKKEETAK